ncbi:T9SS type A sorting domain-containing protein [bacterium]|nr:T9SS type A sorting domain-containing protein [bacterium]
MRRITIGLLCLAAGVLIFGSVVQAQPEPQWVHVYGNECYEYCYWAAPVNDGGYIFTGLRTVPGNEDDVLIIRVDANGETLWERTYGGPLDDCGRQVQQTSDGNFAVTAWTDSYGPGLRSGYLLKLDDNGDMLWTKTYGGTGYNNTWSGIQTSDGGYALTGFSDCSGTQRDMIYLVKTDATGDTLWTQRYGSVQLDYGTRIYQTVDEGFIIAGYTSSFGVGLIDGILIKTDGDGNQEWMQTYGGNSYDKIRDVIQTSDGGYMFVGETASFSVGSYDYWIVKTDAVGDTLWSRTFGGYGDDRAKCVWQTDDGGYVVSGGSYSFGPGEVDAYVKKLCASGDLEWTLAAGGQQYDTGYFVRQLDDGSYMIAGTTESFASGERDFWMIQLGGLEPVLEITLTPESTPIQIPETGGSFNFNLAIFNSHLTTFNLNIWTEVILPDSSVYGPIIGPVALDILPAASLNRNRTQNIPGNAPGGMYTYQANLGIYPDSVWYCDSFEFEKLGSSDQSVWGNCGEMLDADFLGGSRTAPTSQGFELIGAYPNPFNPITAISFQQSAFSHVSLTVYDVSGRKVATLVNGYRDAGVHRVTFDASGFASGVYLYRLEASGSGTTPTTETRVGKMVLMK